MSSTVDDLILSSADCNPTLVSVPEEEAMQVEVRDEAYYRGLLCAYFQDPNLMISSPKFKNWRDVYEEGSEYWPYIFDRMPPVPVLPSPFLSTEKENWEAPIISVYVAITHDALNLVRPFIVAPVPQIPFPEAVQGATGYTGFTGPTGSTGPCGIGRSIPRSPACTTPNCPSVYCAVCEAFRNRKPDLRNRDDVKVAPSITLELDYFTVLSYAIQSKSWKIVEFLIREYPECSGKLSTGGLYEDFTQIPQITLFLLEHQSSQILGQTIVDRVSTLKNEQDVLLYEKFLQHIPAPYVIRSFPSGMHLEGILLAKKYGFTVVEGYVRSKFLNFLCAIEDEKLRELFGTENTLCGVSYYGTQIAALYELTVYREKQDDYWYDEEDMEKQSSESRKDIRLKTMTEFSRKEKEKELFSFLRNPIPSYVVSAERYSMFLREVYREMGGIPCFLEVVSLNNHDILMACIETFPNFQLDSLERLYVSPHDLINYCEARGIRASETDKPISVSSVSLELVPKLKNLGFQLQFDIDHFSPDLFLFCLEHNPNFRETLRQCTPEHILNLIHYSTEKNFHVLLRELRAIQFQFPETIFTKSSQPFCLFVAVRCFGVPFPPDYIISDAFECLLMLRSGADVLDIWQRKLAAHEREQARAIFRSFEKRIAPPSDSAPTPKTDEVGAESTSTSDSTVSTTSAAVSETEGEKPNCIIG